MDCHFFFKTRPIFFRYHFRAALPPPPATTLLYHHLSGNLILTREKNECTFYYWRIAVKTLLAILPDCVVTVSGIIIKSSFSLSPSLHGSAARTSSLELLTSPSSLSLSSLELSTWYNYQSHSCQNLYRNRIL